MIKEILGKKVGMTQIYSKEGDVIPVTVLEAGPCPIVQKKSVDSDGYNAVQIGYGKVKKGKLNKPTLKHFEKHGAKFAKIVKEVRLEGEEIGDVKEVRVETFAEGEKVDVSGVSKGRGFAGVMKRYNMGGSPASRGSHEVFRHVGSLAGGCSRPGRVWAGKRLPGHMGSEKKTVLNLEVIRVIKESNHILVKGAVPGPKGGVVRIRKSNRK